MRHLNRFWLSVTLLAAALAGRSAWADGTTSTSHCSQDEEVVFSCHIHSKVVSLCVSKQAGQIESLAYRYGVLGHVENEFTATRANKKLFFGSVAPAAPKALISQVWFDKEEFRYLLTQCTGGNCPHAAGLTVFRGGRVLANTACEHIETDKPWFTTASKLVDFESSVPDSKSYTALLQLIEADNAIEKLYPPTQAPIGAD
jgi:hypothetical protein